MEKLKQFMLILFASFCIMLATNNADARVCFAGGGDSDDCGSMNSFGDYTDPSKETADECTKAGYTDLASDCRATVGKQISAFCPYNNDYVMCCGLEYAYSKCIFPLQIDGEKCGNKYKCKCDDAKYPYVANGVMIGCRDKRTGDVNSNSYPSGGSCAFMGYNSATHSTTTTLQFTECKCDRALYPYTKELCDANSQLGDICTSIDSNGNRANFYADCICDEKKYPQYEMKCSYGIDKNRPTCKQGGQLKGQCCDCFNFPYKDTTSDSSVKEYASCAVVNNCTMGNAYKAVSCQDNYEVAASGKCVPVACGVYLQKILSDSNTVVVADKTKLSSALGSSNRGKVLIYVPKDGSEVSIGLSAIYPSEIKFLDSYATTYKTWCEKQVRPSIKFTGLTSVNKNITGINANFSNTITVVGGKYTDSKIILYKASISAGNFQNSEISGSTLTITGNFTSKNTTYNINNVYFQSPINIQLSGSQTFRATYMYVDTPVIMFSGGNMYVRNAYLGYLSGPKSTRKDVKVKLSGGAIWNMQESGVTLNKIHMKISEHERNGSTSIGSDNGTYDGAIKSIGGVIYRKLHTDNHEHDRGSRDNANAVCTIDGNGSISTLVNNDTCTTGDCKVRSIGTKNGCNNRGDPADGIVKTR